MPSRYTAMVQIKLLQEYAGHRAGESLCVTAPEAELLIERGAAVDVTPKPGATTETKEAPAPKAPKAPKPAK